MRVFDCFQFFNELDMLEIRLTELSKHVDYFVIVEARQTHDGSPKPMYFDKKRFAPWKKQIIHVVIDLPKLNLFDRTLVKLSQAGALFKLSSKIAAFGHGRMKMDHAQRRGIMQGLTDLKDDDIVMVSDLDEIPNVKVLPKAIKLAQQGKIVGLEQQYFLYYLNGLVDRLWTGPKLCTGKTLRTRLRNDIQNLRIDMREVVRMKFGAKPDLVIVKNGGWHFTYLGGWEKVITKKKVFAHSEISKGDDVSPEQVKKDIEEGVMRYKDVYVCNVKYVPIDKTFPTVVIKNQKKYAHLIKKPKKRS